MLFLLEPIFSKYNIKLQEDFKIIQAFLKVTQLNYDSKICVSQTVVVRNQQTSGREASPAPHPGL